MPQVAADMLEIWNDEQDRFSFEDSDRFEEDSLCSWSTEPESVCNNWRGWKRPIYSNNPLYSSGKKSTPDGNSGGGGSRIGQLVELSARCVASHIPFELVEHVYPPVPEQLQLRIAFWSFPDNEEDIRLYSCLANSSADEFQRGEHLFKSRAVKDPLQIGFHLSATVLLPSSYSQRGQYNVAVAFDRRRITSCNCTCDSRAYWCSHIVAVCLHRIHLPTQVVLRAPVSESLSRLARDQLQKFAQYLISELPQQILPTAQRILDELLSSQPSAINSVCGAPDPTAGASVNETTSWYLDEKTLHDNIKKILIKFCIPAPMVFSDVNYLSTTAPPAAAEWTSLLRPLRGREPEGMWNLLSIVREMYKRGDRNALPLLQIITEECIACEQIMVWWFNTKVALHAGASGGGGGGKHSNVNSNSHGTQHACASLCDEVVCLWRLAALNPALSPSERSIFLNQFNEWHIKIIDKVEKSRPLHGNTAYQTERVTKNLASSIEVFSGFKPAISACQLDWDDYQIPGVTYQGGAAWLSQPITCFKNSDAKSDAPVNQISSSPAVLNPLGGHHGYHSCFARQRRTTQRLLGEIDMDLSLQMYQMNVSGSASGNRSSVSSEGFCENEQESNTQEEDANETGGESRTPGPSLEALDSSASSLSSEAGPVQPVVAGPSPLLHKLPTPQPVAAAVQGGGGPASESPSGDESESGGGNSGKPAASAAAPHGGVVLPPASVAPSISAPSAASALPLPIPIPGPSTDPRRLSKDDSLSSNSDSQQSSDEYFVYYFDPKSLEKAPQGKTEKKEEEKRKPSLSGVTGPKDPWDVLFARAEGLHAHGQGKEACGLGVRLAEELLASPPDLMVELPPLQTKGKRKKINPASHQLSILASDTLAKCAFLCTVLTENPDHFHLAFRVGLFGLEMPRPPATTKPLEVKLFHQESELVTLLKRIPLGEKELRVIRERAEQLRDGGLRARGEALLPLTLASYILDALTMPGKESKCQLISAQLILPTDEQLGFEAATAALGLKANVSEADHPLLCEGTRRQRGELAVTLLVHYKDQPPKIAQIMEKLLDRQVHQLTKGPLCPSYYTSHPPVKSLMSAAPSDWSCDLEHHPLLPESAPSLPPPSAGSDLPMGMVMRSSPGLGNPEVEQCLPSKPLGLPPSSSSAIPPPSSGRPKEARFKGKRLYPSIPNQPSEAGAHFMFELAKTVLVKAGGNSSTSLFTQASTSRDHHGPQRALHMCAFQLGLYALGLHNCVSPNWLSRTYSSHVSWITGQAMEIGAPAISFLQDTWEGHLTPPEAASIADRASRGCDRNMTRAAAELALSCLPHAAALNPNEIQRAILQCKEQSDRMLEHSCLTVEGAAKGGGVYPDVLFQVAKYWFELYLRNSQGEQFMEEGLMPGSGGGLTPEGGGMNEPPPAHAFMAAWVEQAGPPPTPPPPPPPTAPPIPPPAAPPPPPQYVSPLTIPYPVITIAPHPASHYIRHPHQIAVQTFHVPGPPYQYYQTNPPTHVFSATPIQVGPGGQAQLASLAQAAAAAPQPAPQPPPPQVVAVSAAPPPPQLRPHQPQIQRGGGQQQQQAVQVQQQGYTPAQVRYLLAAYRVGMLAMETIARRVHDDRPNAKYARHPPYGEDVKWLLRIAEKLGTQYLQQFCVCAVNSIVSPFILHHVAIEAAHYLARNNPTLVMQHLRSSLSPLVQKCQQMYIQCLHQKLYHLSASEYDEFINIVRSARSAFQISPEGSQQFKEWLQSIRRSKSCKKELWAQISVLLQQPVGK